MKGARSNRVPTTEPPDDWVDGSWTVDCICGVTFDDGEEMVNCDDCGVWVHTRCSRFVKGDKSFACHKCKSVRTRTVTDAEETEVAQLLVDLPTKTIHQHLHQHHKIKMSSNVNSSSPTCLRPYRLWTERPLEDRVHVQGIPGGDTSLFPSDNNPFPSLINSHLWKCSGYIPKRFRFSYSEFPSWPNTSQTPLSPAPPSPPPCDNKRNALLHLSTKRFREHSRKDRAAKKKIKAAHRDDASKRDKLCSPNTAGNPSSTTESKAHKVAGKLAPEDTPLGKPVLDRTQLHKSTKTTLKSLLSPDRDATSVTHIKKEGLVLDVDETQIARAESLPLTNDMLKSQPTIEGLTNSAAKCKNTKIHMNSEAINPPGSGHCIIETKSDAHFEIPKDVLASHPAGNNIKSDSLKNLGEHAPDQECKGSTLSEGAANTSKPLEQDGKDNDNGSEAGCPFDRNDEITKIHCSTKLECEGSDSSMEDHKFLCESKEDERAVGQTPQPNGAVPPPPVSHHKMATVGKSCSTSPAIVFSRSYHPDKSRGGGSQNASLVGKRFMSNSCVNTKKEYAPVNSLKNEDKQDKPVNTLKDNPKPGFNSTMKASQPSRTVVKCYTSLGKDSLRHSSSKVSSFDSSLVSSSVSEPDEEALQSENAVCGQNKNIGSEGLQQTEKVHQSNTQPPHKSNQSSMGHPAATSNSPAGLSDEELALLLHQELNSSPRVPRVPRVRNAGSLPQLSSASAANMLMKRTSTSGGKDKNTFSRRKGRDGLKDGSHNSREQDSEASKVDRLPSSPDSLKKKSDAFILEDVNSNSKPKKNRDKVSSSAANSGPFSADAVELKSSSSARVNSPEDAAGANKNSDLTCRTLPGLIADIMGTGRRMTYEELCNSVLPHWPNLRKHNGERYAYSSHSQAVLDCLRNRTEWARLVDRGPKTSSSRKKRKVDAEPLSSESEDGEDRNLKDGENKLFESNKEDFPKGRRQARKRRGLAPQGRSVKDSQKRRKVEVGSSCDSGTSSNSSEDSVSSQDDSQGSEMDMANTEVSASSH